MYFCNVFQCGLSKINHSLISFPLQLEIDFPEQIVSFQIYHLALSFSTAFIQPPHHLISFSQIHKLKSLTSLLFLLFQNIITHSIFRGTSIYRRALLYTTPKYEVWCLHLATKLDVIQMVALLAFGRPFQNALNAESLKMCKMTKMPILLWARRFLVF